MKLAVKENREIERGEKILGFALSLLPRALSDEIRRITENRRDCPLGISEIRVRRGGISSIVISGESIRLSRGVTDREMQSIFDRITGGSLYALERELKDGYLTLENGIRVGIARSEIKTESRLALAMVFRLPLSRCTYVNELYALFAKTGGGMLLFSPPAAGKTTALSHLARAIAERDGRHVVIVDERGEFPPTDFSDTTVDILRGYPKAKGIEIALRTLGAEIIVTDEIGNGTEAESIEACGRGGVPFIASVHAASIGEVYSKAAIASLIRRGFFDTLVRLYKSGSEFCFEPEAVIKD